MESDIKTPPFLERGSSLKLCKTLSMIQQRLLVYIDLWLILKLYLLLQGFLCIFTDIRSFWTKHVDLQCLFFSQQSAPAELAPVFSPWWPDVWHCWQLFWRCTDSQAIRWQKLIVPPLSIMCSRTVARWSGSDLFCPASECSFPSILPKIFFSPFFLVSEAKTVTVLTWIASSSLPNISP